MTILHTTLGQLKREQLGLILPHEHVFVDLRTPDQPGYAQADAADVVALMAPQIEAIKAQGVTALIECSTGGVGLRVDLDLAVSEEKDFGLHREVFARGAWLEFDHIGRAPDVDIVALVTRALEAGQGERLLLSHDRGWYDPAQPGGGTPQPYTHLVETFLPALRAAGVDEATITRLTHDNPFDAFAR